MRRFLKPFLIVPLFAAAVVAGCEAVGPTATDSLDPPAASEAFLGGLLGGESVQGYTLLKEPILPGVDDVLNASSLIGGEGGQLSLLGHTLTVPRGAVSTPTLFTLTVLPTGYVEVDLTATTRSLFGSLVNVGERGFDRPVAVTLSYARATNVKNPAKLQVVYLKGLLGYGSVEPVRSVVNPDTRTVTAQLEHFSRYALAMP